MGGIRQRMQAEELVPAESKLAHYLVTSWAWGEMTPQQVQKIAQLACEDSTEGRRLGRNLADLEKLAGLGSCGRHSNNCHRDLVRCLPPTRLCPPAVSEIPLRLKTTTAPRPQSIFWPHEVFSSIFHQYPEAWKERLCPGSSEISNFWRQMEGTTELASHPVRLRDGYQEKAIPLSIHGDGVPVTGRGKKWCKFADIFSWTSMLASGPTIDIMFFIWMSIASLSSKAAGQHTLHTFFTQLVWSLTALWEGRWPAADHTGAKYRKGSLEAKRAGEPLAQGYFGVLWCLKGDLDYFASTLDLQRYSNLKPCCFCQADSSTTPWTDFREGAAAWMQTEWGAEDWLAAHPERNPIFTLPGCTILTVHADFMHCKHLGTDQHLLGSVLWLLCYRNIAAGEPEDHLKIAFERICDYYRAHPVSTRFTSLRLSMFTSPKQPTAGPPKLKGRSAELRHFAPALSAAWEAAMAPDNLVHQQVKALLRRSVRLEEILDRHPKAYALPTPAAREFLKAAYEMLALHSALNTHFEAEGLQLFHVTVKAHYLLHCARKAEVVSPRLSWCYCGEDFMQKMRCLVGSCCKGVQPSQIINKVAQKYQRAMHMQLSGRSFKLK
jgi:hypothetical protein